MRISDRAWCPALRTMAGGMVYSLCQTTAGIRAVDVMWTPQGGRLLDDLENRALAQLGGSGGEDRAQRLGGLALLADHLAEIFLRDDQLEHGGLFADDL